MFTLTNDDELEDQKQQIEFGNVESDRGTVGEMLVNRHNQKHVLLLELLLYHKEDFRRALNTNDLTLTREQRDTILNFNRNFAKKAYEFANGKYTSPHYGFSSKKAATKTIKAAEKENHLCATMHSILTEMPSGGTTNSTVKLAILKELKNNDNNKKRYDTLNAVKTIISEVGKIYSNDKLVSKIIRDIQTNNQNQMKLDIKILIGIITHNTIKETKRVGTQDFVLEKVSFVDHDSDFDGEKKIYTTKIKAGGISFSRKEIRNQSTNKSGADISSAGLTYFLKDNKRYYVNKDTGYIFETPNKDIDSLRYDDNVRIFDGIKWHDYKDNAVFSDIAVAVNGEMMGDKIMFSYYDENRKSYVYCNPFSDEIKIFEVENSGKYSRSTLNTRLEGDIKELREGKSIDLKKYKDDGFKGLGTYDILLEENVYDQIQSIDYIRRYGYNNPILPCRLKLNYTNFNKIKDTYENADDAAFRNFLHVENKPNEDKYKELTNWFDDNKIISAKNIKYKNGLQTRISSNDLNNENQTIQDLLGGVALFVDVPTIGACRCSCSNEMLQEDDNKEFINLLDGEVNNYKNYSTDLALEAYNRKQKFEEAEKYAAENPVDERKIEQLKIENKNRAKNMQIQAELEEQKNLDIIGRALNVLRGINEQGMLVKFFKSIYKFFTGKKFISKDEKKYEDAIYTIRAHSNSVTLTNDNAEVINSVVGKASNKIGVEPPIINFNIKFNLKNAKKQKSKG